MKKTTGNELLAAGASGGASDRLADLLNSMPQAHVHTITAADITAGSVNMEFGFTIQDWDFRGLSDLGTPKGGPITDTAAINANGTSIDVTLPGGAGDLAADEFISMTAWGGALAAVVS